MTTTRTVKCNGRAYPVRMGWNAIVRIEETLKLPIQVVGEMMKSGRAGVRELGIVFWAGLETARLHGKTRPNPWTLEEVGDLIDETGSEEFFKQVYQELLDGIVEAFPSQKKDAAKKGGDRKGRGPQGTAPTTTSGTAADDSEQATSSGS